MVIEGFRHIHSCQDAHKHTVEWLLVELQELGVMVLSQLQFDEVEYLSHEVLLREVREAVNKDYY